MKTIIFIALVFAFSLGHSQEKYKYLNVINGSDRFTIKMENENIIVLDYSKFDVTIKKNYKKGGETIIVCDNSLGDTIISIQAGPIYFYGIYDYYLFVDEGTGTKRSMKIYDLKFQDFIFSFSYEREPNLRSDSVFYDYPFPMTREVMTNFPACPDSITKSKQYGYFERRIFLLNSNKSINSGDIKCEVQE